MALANRLQEIVDYKWTEIEKLLPRAEKLRLAALGRDDVRSLYNALNPVEDGEQDQLAVIAEVKRASPSAGDIVQEFDPVAIARTYDASGASAISVLTDERFFRGKLDYLTKIREAVSVPCLRKDFILHEAQIWEAVVAGADAVLLIVACLEQEDLVHLLGVAEMFQLDALVEVHNREELDRALETDARIIGVNNRNLKTFEVDLGTTEILSEDIPDDIVLVSESGIKSAEDARQVRRWGCDAILVGESLMRSPDVPAMIHSLTGA